MKCKEHLVNRQEIELKQGQYEYLFFIFKAFIEVLMSVVIFEYVIAPKKITKHIKKHIYIHHHKNIPIHILICMSIVITH